MFKNYFKTALRNLKRNKSYAMINVLGLAVGIAASLLIFLIIQFETSFDNFHKKKNSIYRLGTQFHNQDGIGYSDGVSFPTGPALRMRSRIPCCRVSVDGTKCSLGFSPY